MKNVLVFDIESDRFSEFNKKPIYFRFAYFVGNGFEKYLSNREEFDSFLLSLCKRNNGKKKNYLVYAHNLMFDFSFCLKVFLDNGYIVKPIENGGKLLSVSIGKYRTKNRKDKFGNTKEVKEFDKYLEFRDTYSLFQTSLKNLGVFVGLNKLEHDKEFSDEPSEFDKEYCKIDCQIVYKALEKFTDFMNSEIPNGFSLETLPLSTASSSFKLFKHNNSIFDSEGKPDCIWINRNENQNNDFLKNYYFGGRVELHNCSYMENVSYYDINSLYPSVMIKNSFHKPPYFEKIFGMQDLTDETTIGFYAIVDERHETFPLIPEHYQSGLYFPAKIKNTFIFKEEYDYLFSQGVNIQPMKTLFAKYKAEYPFAYLERFYALKSKKDTMSYFYKILMNATYGRFGIDNEKESFELMKFDENIDLSQMGIELIDETTVKLMKPRIMRFERNLILASKITALARLEITKWAKEIIRNGYKVYYMDTDSIVASENTVLPMDEKLLGYFKKEHEFSIFQAIGNKEYIGKVSQAKFYENLDINNGKIEFLSKNCLFFKGSMKRNALFDKWIVKLKGVHNSDLQSLFDYHSEGVFQINVSKLKGMVNSGKLEQPHNILMMKKSNTFYHKRLLLPDNSSLPITELSKSYLSEIEEQNALVLSKRISELQKRLGF